MAAAEAPDRSFPKLTESTWADHFAQALRDDPRVALTEESIELLKWLVPRPKDLLRSTKVEGVFRYRLKDEVIRTKRVRDGANLVLLRTEIFGAAISISAHNDRLAGKWGSPFIENAGKGAPILPARVQVALDGDRPAAEFVIGVTDETEARKLISHAATLLDEEERRRTYSLKESLAAEGQRDPGMSVFCRYVTADGRTFQTLSAVAGNNRALRRAELHRLQPEEVALGVPETKLGLGNDSVKVVRSPAAWLAPLFDQLEAKIDGASDDTFAELTAACGVSVVEEEIVVGVSPSSALSSVLHRDNADEHIHAVLDYGDSAKFDALGRQLLERYVSEGAISELQRAVLTGDAAPAADSDPALFGLAGPYDPADPASRFALRDWRDRTLIALVYPTDKDRQKLVRKVLAEPAPSQLTEQFAKIRSRLLAVLQGRGHARPWNTRASDVYTRKQARYGIPVSDTPLGELIEAATPGQPSEELLARVTPLLAAHQLVVADRGSLDDGEEGVPSGRRQPRNALTTIAGSGQRGLTFLAELANADKEGRAARRVEDDGQLSEDDADRDWLNSTQGFPRTAQAPKIPAPEPEEAELDAAGEFEIKTVALIAHSERLHELLDSFADICSEMADLAAAEPGLALNVDTYNTLRQRLVLEGAKRLKQVAEPLDELVEVA